MFCSDVDHVVTLFMNVTFIFFNTMDIDFDCIIAYKSDTDDHSN